MTCFKSSACTQFDVQSRRIAFMGQIDSKCSIIHTKAIKKIYSILVTRIRSRGHCQMDDSKVHCIIKLNDIAMLFFLSTAIKTFIYDFICLFLSFGLIKTCRYDVKWPRWRRSEGAYAMVRKMRIQSNRRIFRSTTDKY